MGIALTIVSMLLAISIVYIIASSIEKRGTINVEHVYNNTETLSTVLDPKLSTLKDLLSSIMDDSWTYEYEYKKGMYSYDRNEHKYTFTKAVNDTTLVFFVQLSTKDETKNIKADNILLTEDSYDKNELSYIGNKVAEELVIKFIYDNIVHKKRLSENDERLKKATNAIELFKGSVTKVSRNRKIDDILKNK